MTLTLYLKNSQYNNDYCVLSLTCLTWWLPTAAETCNQLADCLLICQYKLVLYSILIFHWLNKWNCGTVGWGTALQVGRSRVRFPMSQKFFIDIILPGVEYFLGVGLTTVPPSCAFMSLILLEPSRPVQACNVITFTHLNTLFMFDCCRRHKHKMVFHKLW
jgi:hypothetical protein